MKDDYLHTLKLQIPDKNVGSTADIIEQQLLHDLDNMLRSAVPSKSMGDFGLPVPSSDVIGILQNRLLLEELRYDREGLMKEHNELVPKLNSDQRSVYNTVVSSIENKKQILMFVYGHGGTGKTFLWTTILSYFRSIGKIVLAVAASGIASLLLPSGTTAHSRFKIPIDLTDKKSCDIKKRSFLGELMQRTTLIIWDEAPMSDRRCFEFLDRSLRDVLDCDQQPFGGISMLLGGDFRQTLPVVPKSTRSEIIALTLPSSYLWPYFTVRILHTNMRLQSSDITTQNSMSTSAFARWLLAIGDGIIGIPDKDDPRDSSWVQIPSSLLISATPNSLQTLIDFVYGDGILIDPTAADLSVRAIVSPTNETADEINTHILKIVRTSGRTYNSTDIMEPNGKHTSDMEGLKRKQLMTSISDLKTDGIGGPLQVRILRKWKHDVRRYETWYLAVDRFADAIQILGQRTNQSYIESVLHVSQCYTISDYSCPQLDNYQKFLENEFYIDVGLKSIIQPIPETTTIPKTWFRFVSKSHLIDLGERPPYYPDYIGVLSKIRECTKASGESFVLLILTDERLYVMSNMIQTDTLEVVARYFFEIRQVFHQTK
ncbi:unnamed protein product [Lactuca saligna]|uniref:ATP-dependent DNA helicase n=1 Tax=Lactuca saligna TaxID=75948 RepID=A0AA35YVN4_LACSI|nr:unnamed protein product [Lactuca saligna]